MALKLKTTDWYQLRRFLVNREKDIAYDIEDFGVLQKVFLVVVGRKAESK